MARIAFLILCHRDPDGVAAQARRLTQTGDCVAIHFDARAPQATFRKLQAAVADIPRVHLVRRRVKCGWGEWSLVQATLNALSEALEAFPRATHVYMMSGDCWPIKPAHHVHRTLDAADADFIESYDFLTSDWIKTGIREERLVYRHVFNERTQKRAYYAALALQQRLGLRRPLPGGIDIMIGSQWWCLRRRTAEAVMAFVHARRDVVRFFRTTWIPDETFFQTLVNHLVPSAEIRRRSLTLKMFSDYGMPVVFYNDQYDLLVAQDALFARKISPEAADLKRRLGRLYGSATEVATSNEMPKLYAFLTGQGRIGHRFAPRFWERFSTIGRDRELLIVLCKKWHVAKRLTDQVAWRSNIPALEYLFDEEETRLPDLGGIEATLPKRTRHHRAVMAMLFDHYETDRLMICLDPANYDLLEDFYTDRSTTRMLEIETTLSDTYLAGHARRVGLAGTDTSDTTVRQLVPTIRAGIHLEIDRIRDAKFPNTYRMREDASPDENAAPLSKFLSMPREVAREVAATHYLFAD